MQKIGQGELVDKGKTALVVFPEGPIKDTLKEMAEFIIKRKH